MFKRGTNCAQKGEKAKEAMSPVSTMQGNAVIFGGEKNKKAHHKKVPESHEVIDQPQSPPLQTEPSDAGARA